MDHILLNVLFFGFLFSITQSFNPFAAFDERFDKQFDEQFESYLSDYYRTTAKDFVSKHLNGMDLLCTIKHFYSISYFQIPNFVNQFYCLLSIH